MAKQLDFGFPQKQIRLTACLACTPRMAKVGPRCRIKRFEGITFCSILCAEQAVRNYQLFIIGEARGAEDGIATLTVSSKPTKHKG
mgnify:CR=1 FL=1